jgi:hypothetical protein
MTGDMVTLSDRWARELVDEPETRMGSQIATVTLKDGRRFPKTAIVDGIIVEIDRKRGIPFAESDIASIVVDHGKKQSFFFYVRRSTRRTIARIKEAIRGRLRTRA